MSRDESDYALPGRPATSDEADRRRTALAGPASSWRPPQTSDETPESPTGVAGPHEPASDPTRIGPVPRRRPRVWVNALMFVLTLATTTYWGFLQYQQFYLDDAGSIVLDPREAPDMLLAGLPFGLAVIAFLLAHEMGHYLACRYYGIQATLPYFIPIPSLLPFSLLPGTMGAVIRILGPIKSRRALFDIAVAGPIAGFVAALPILAVGLSQSRVLPVSETQGGGYLMMGEPLIWGPLQAVFAPALGPEQTLVAHPLAFVGWFALLVTAMNLLPVGQLDGGHLLYAFVPRFHRVISLGVVAAMFYAGLAYFSGWIFFAFVVFFVLGTRHPKPAAFERTLGTPRLAVGLVAILIFITSFMLVPVRIEAF